MSSTNVTKEILIESLKRFCFCKPNVKDGGIKIQFDTHCDYWHVHIFRKTRFEDYFEKYPFLDDEYPWIL